MEGVAVKPLTVGFHETPFLSKLNQENKLGFWFQLSDRERQQVGSPWGPSDPQNLNRYSYVQNNPVRWTDPTGHWTFSVDYTWSGFAIGGGRFSISVALDQQGNVGLVVSPGGGGYTAAGGSAGISGTWTPAPSINDLKGWSAQVGGSVREAVGPGGELVFFQSNGVGYVGVSLGGGAGLQVPFPAEIHGTMTYSFLPFQCNIRTGVCQNVFQNGDSSRRNNTSDMGSNGTKPPPSKNDSKRRT
jgi:hypothetical protein